MVFWQFSDYAAKEVSSGKSEQLGSGSDSVTNQLCDLEHVLIPH